MTNTETCMREMRHIVFAFKHSKDFDEQWIWFKAFLNTLHSLSDNDKIAKSEFHNDELMNFALVLRNILHHQPAKWHFGKHDVYPTSLSLKLVANAQPSISGSLSLVIQKNTLEDEKLQQVLGSNSKKQLEVLKTTLSRMNGDAIPVFNLMEEIQEHVEQYCKKSQQYTKAYDDEPSGYNLIQTTYSNA